MAPQLPSKHSTALSNSTCVKLIFVALLHVFLSFYSAIEVVNCGRACLNLPEIAFRCTGSMIPFTWDFAADRVFKAIRRRPNITASDVSLAIVIAQDALFFCALSWILYRCWQIYMKPRDELEELLGLDIPLAPEVSLAGITSDSVLLYYKPPDIQVATLKLSILVNGIKVGEFSRNDTSIQINGLKSGNHYNIRVLATNTSNFTTSGPTIRLRTTLPPTPDDGGAARPRDANAQSEPAAVHATSTPFETTLSPLPGRESSNTHYQTKRVLSGRRNSPATSGGELGAVQNVPAANNDEDESPEAIQKLTGRLNFLRAEVERVDRETAEEDEESKRNIAELTKERDRLRQEYKEKEEASLELRRQGNQLDKLNRAAQSRKAAKEKLLHQKKAERQKLKEDIARYERETLELRQDTERMRREKEEITAAKDRDIAEIRSGISEDLAAIKSIEEDIRVIGARIKAKEKGNERLTSGRAEGCEEQDPVGVDRGSDQAWEAKMEAMQTQAASLWQTLQQVQLEQDQAEEHLSRWMAKWARNPEQFAPFQLLIFPPSIQRSISRRNRQSNSRTSTTSSPSAGYQGGSGPFNNASTVSPPFPSTSPFFNIANGMSTPLPERLHLTQTEAEMLAGGGPISPAANNLLPSNLLGDDDLTNQRLPNSTSRDTTNNNGATGFMLGHTMTNSDASVPGPHTPGSAGSRPGSILASPQDSSQNLHGYQTRPDPFIEGDQHSISSTNAQFNSSLPADSNPMTTSRLASLFSSTFNRQRKSAAQEPPLLGTLKQGQSQSFPSNVEPDFLDLNGDQRRRGSQGNWANPMSGLLTRNTSTSEGSGLITARTGSGRRSRLNMFAPKIDALESAGFVDQPSSSRPSSTYSYDQVLARPSNDSQRFGWPAPENIPNRNSPLGAHLNWASGPWSRTPSRRPSVQHGSTSNLSVGSTPLNPDGFTSSFSKPNFEQAPIGTRPQSSQRPATPRLNPAAPSFKTLFTRGDAKKPFKGEKPGGKSAEKTKDRGKEHAKCETDDMESAQESPPQNRRLSRDAQSVTTAASTADSRESFDRSTSGTPSEALTPFGPKETLMQKISRKSSSSKFNVPWGKERGLFSKRTGEPSTPGEVDEDNSSENQLGKSVESPSSTTQQEKAGRSSLSWSNIRRKSKKTDQPLTEAMGKGSEVEDDEDA